MHLSQFETGPRVLVKTFLWVVFLVIWVAGFSLLRQHVNGFLPVVYTIIGVASVCALAAAFMSRSRKGVQQHLATVTMTMVLGVMVFLIGTFGR